MMHLKVMHMSNKISHTRDHLGAHYSYLISFVWISLIIIWGFPGSSVVKNPPANVGNAGSIPGLGRAPGEGNGDPLQYSCLENPWTEEAGGLQSMGSQKIWTQLSK